LIAAILDASFAILVRARLFLQSSAGLSRSMIGMGAAFPGCRGGIARPLSLYPPPFYTPDLIGIFN
jgi:hypothetical protein